MTLKRLDYLIAPKIEAFTEFAPRLSWEIEAMDLPGRARHSAELVIEELVTNVIRHGGEATSSIELAIVVDGFDLLVTVIDDGRPFDPTAARSVERPGSLADLKIGGLGLTMIRNATSAFSYERLDGRNRVLARIPIGR